MSTAYSNVFVPRSTQTLMWSSSWRAQQNMSTLQSAVPGPAGAKLQAPPRPHQGNCMLLFIPSFHTDTDVYVRSHRALQTHIFSVFLPTARKPVQVHILRRPDQQEQNHDCSPFCEYSETFSCSSLTA